MDSARVSERLDALVSENRFTIAVVFPAVGALMMVASAEGLLPDPLSFNPALLLFGTLVMRTPLVAGLLPTIDRRGAFALLALTAYTYAVEFVGVETGLPYGGFEYGIELGPMLFDTVPIGLPAFFFPLVVNAYLLVLLLSSRRAAGPLGAPARILAALAVVLIVDAVLDPAAVALVGDPPYVVVDDSLPGVPAAGVPDLDRDVAGRLVDLQSVTRRGALHGSPGPGRGVERDDCGVGTGVVYRTDRGL